MKLGIIEKGVKIFYYKKSWGTPFVTIISTRVHATSLNPVYIVPTTPLNRKHYPQRRFGPSGPDDLRPNSKFSRRPKWVYLYWNQTRCRNTISHRFTSRINLYYYSLEETLDVILFSCACSYYMKNTAILFSCESYIAP